MSIELSEDLYALVEAWGGARGMTPEEALEELLWPVLVGGSEAAEQPSLM